MKKSKYPLTKAEFDFIYSKVPRLTVEVIVKNAAGAIYLTKRAIEPCKGLWHLPGGTVRMGESLMDSVIRLALNELGIEVEKAFNNGYIEYPSHYQKEKDHPLGLVFEVTKYKGKIKINSEASEGDWFSEIPTKMHPDQDSYLLLNKYLIRKN